MDSKCMFSFFDRNSVTCCWNTDEEGRLIPTPSLQPLQPQGRTQRSQGAEAIPRRGLRPSMSPLPRRSPHCYPPFCHLENSVEAPRKTVPQSSPAKKKIMEFLVWHTAAKELYALWFEVTNCSCWLVLLQPRIPRLPPISQAYLVTYINVFLLFSIRLMFYKVLCCMFTYL